MRCLIKSLYIIFSSILLVSACVATDKGTDFSDILDLPVIHATHYLPKDGIMIPGICAKEDCNVEGWDIKKGDRLPGPLGWRPTIHWSIGKLAEDIPGKNTISDRPYAVITTLRQLKHQLVGLGIEDTFVLGSFKLPSNAHIIHQSHDLSTTLKQKIDKCIDEKYCSNPQTRVLMGKTEEDEEKLSKRLQTFAKQNPHIIFGLHDQHPTCIIEDLVPYLCINAYEDLSTDIIKNIYLQSERAFNALSSYYMKSLSNLSNESEPTLEKIIREEVARLKKLIQDLSIESSRTPEQKYRDYIGSNDDENMNKKIEKFLECYEKMKVYVVDFKIY